MNDYVTPWDLIILSALHEGHATELRDIYKFIEKNPYYINSQLLEIEPKWGNRPKYHHVMRSTISNLVKNGLVKRLGRGEYIITNDGKERLRKSEFPTE